MGRLDIAFARLGRGLLGLWCIAGPIALIVSYHEFEPVVLIVFIALVLVVYAIGISKWRDQGTAWLRLVAIDTVLSLVFAAVGALIGGLIAGFSGSRVLHHGALTLVWILLGFWLLEMRKRTSFR